MLNVVESIAYRLIRRLFLCGYLSTVPQWQPFALGWNPSVLPASSSRCAWSTCKPGSTWCCGSASFRLGGPLWTSVVIHCEESHLSLHWSERAMYSYHFHKMELAHKRWQGSEHEQLEKWQLFINLSYIKHLKCFRGCANHFCFRAYSRIWWSCNCSVISESGVSKIGPGDISSWIDMLSIIELPLMINAQWERSENFYRIRHNTSM